MTATFTDIKNLPEKVRDAIGDNALFAYRTPGGYLVFYPLDEIEVDFYHVKFFNEKGEMVITFYNNVRANVKIRNGYGVVEEYTLYTTTVQEALRRLARLVDW